MCAIMVLEKLKNHSISRKCLPDYRDRWVKKLAWYRAHGILPYNEGTGEKVVKDYTVGIKYVRFICYPTRDSNGEKRAKA